MNETRLRIRTRDNRKKVTYVIEIERGISIIIIIIIIIKCTTQEVKIEKRQNSTEIIRLYPCNDT